MKVGQEFLLPLVGIATGDHNYVFELESSFFEVFALEFFTEPFIKVVLKLHKQPNLLQFQFSITGTVLATCDRCADSFTLNLWEDFEYIGKFATPEMAEQLNVEDQEILYFSKTEQYADISELIYEMLMLSMPIQVAHPLDDNGIETCNMESLKAIQKYINTNVETAATNSLGEQIKKLKTK